MEEHRVGSEQRRNVFYLKLGPQIHKPFCCSVFSRFLRECCAVGWSSSVDESLHARKTTLKSKHIPLVSRNQRVSASTELYIIRVCVCVCVCEMRENGYMYNMCLFPCVNVFIHPSLQKERTEAEREGELKGDTV